MLITKTSAVRKLRISGQFSKHLHFFFASVAVGNLRAYSKKALLALGSMITLERRLCFLQASASFGVHMGDELTLLVSTYSPRDTPSSSRHTRT